jgi:hypothetical protein
VFLSWPSSALLCNYTALLVQTASDLFFRMLSCTHDERYVFLKDRGRKAPFRYVAAAYAPHFRTDANLALPSYTRHTNYLATFHAPPSERPTSPGGGRCCRCSSRRRRRRRLLPRSPHRRQAPVCLSRGVGFPLPRLPRLLSGGWFIGPHLCGAFPFLLFLRRCIPRWPMAVSFPSLNAGFVLYFSLALPWCGG